MKTNLEESKTAGIIPINEENSEEFNELGKTHQLPYIIKKKEFTKFKKLVKSGKFTTAVFSAKACGVTRETIREWLKLPTIRQLFNETADKYISKIEVSKDWKAQAYLLDKIHKEEDTTTPQTMIGLSINIQK